MQTAVVTVVAGRHEHLRRQRAGLLASTQRPDQHIIVAMGDPVVRRSLDPSPILTTVLDLPKQVHLPLAAARNAGAASALASGANLLIGLDVDCIPSPILIERYTQAAIRHPKALLAGPVRYLPPAGPGGYPADGLDNWAEPHPARPAPPDHTTLVATDYDLFWSLSFALKADTWNSIGGFCETYQGYGGEDTDFARVAHRKSVELRWVGGADAFHQHHPVSNPPIEHLDAILRNAHIFHQRWSDWPMLGWLRAFADAGLIAYQPADHAWVRI